MRPIGLTRGARTPFAKMDRELAPYNAVELSRRLVDFMLERNAELVPAIRHCIWGMVTPDPDIYSIAREVVLASRLDNRVEAYSVARACATSLQSVTNAAAYYQAFPDERSITLAGGVESFSSVRPALTTQAARLFKTLVGKASWTEKLAAILRTPPRALWPVPPAAREYSTGLTMGEHCELMVKEFRITRERQDAFALASHQHAVRARPFLVPHLMPIDGLQRDTLIRDDTSLVALRNLRPAFDRTQGSITAGNASPYTDGAAALYVLSPALEGALPLDGRLLDFEYVAVNPMDGLLMGPGKAMLTLLARHRLRWDEIDYLEVHEAFAGQVLCNVEAVNRADYRRTRYGIEYDAGILDERRLNPWGSSIAYGHPFGATGARMLNHALLYLEQERKRRALLGVCTAGGLAGACLIERP